MKKFIVLCSMIVALGFVATGCGGGDTTPAVPAAVEGPAEIDEGGAPADEAE